MKVEIINPDEVVGIFSHWCNFSKVCYDTQTKNPSAIGKHCLKSGHFSGSRSRYIEFLITDCPRLVIDQLARHEAGVAKNVQSFRYVDKANFVYAIPNDIQDNPTLVKHYIAHMNNTIDLYREVQDYVLTKTTLKERAKEQARYVLPMATCSAVAIGMDVEALIHFCNKRLCVRTEDVHRELAIMIRNAVVDLIPDLKPYLVPQCEYLTWCPEQHGCGKYKHKGE